MAEDTRKGSLKKTLTLEESIAMEKQVYEKAAMSHSKISSDKRRQTPYEEFQPLAWGTTNASTNISGKGCLTFFIFWGLLLFWFKLELTKGMSMLN